MQALSPFRALPLSAGVGPTSRCAETRMWATPRPLSPGHSPSCYHARGQGVWRSPSWEGTEATSHRYFPDPTVGGQSEQSPPNTEKGDGARDAGWGVRGGGGRAAGGGFVPPRGSRWETHTWPRHTPGYPCWGWGQGGGREVGEGGGLFKEMSFYKCKSSNYTPTHTPIGS